MRRIANFFRAPGAAFANICVPSQLPVTRNLEMRVFPQRPLSTATAVSEAPSPVALRELFSEPIQLLSSVSEGTPGLFEFPNLQDVPLDFITFGHERIADIVRLRDDCVDGLEGIRTTDDALVVFEKLDDISNSICLFLDPSEVYFNSRVAQDALHGDPGTPVQLRHEVEALREVHFGALQLLHHLNNDDELLSVVRRVMELSDGFPEEQQRLLAVEMYEDMVARAGDVELLQQIDVAVHSYSLLEGHDRTARRQQLEAAVKVLSLRSELAQTMGKESYAHMVMRSNLLSSPEAVDGFLRKLHERVCAEEKEETSESPGSDSRSIAASFRNYVSLGASLHGLAELCEKTFGIGLVPEAMSRAELSCWWKDYEDGNVETEAPLVRKLAFVDLGTRDVLGKCYLDFGDPSDPSPSPHFRAVHRAACVGTTRLHPPQLPRVVVTCDFSDCVREGEGEESVEHIRLGLSELQVLFHEFGHALHMIVGSTKYQSQSGTRTSPDFPEFVSQMFELFLRDYRVVKRFAFSEDGEVMPKEVFDAAHAVLKDSPDAVKRRIASAAFDMAIHTTTHSVSVSDFNEVYEAVRQDFRVAPSISLDHLIGVGANLFSYLSTGVLAEDVFAGLFQADPFDQEAGRFFVDAVLRPGGSVHPSSIIRKFAERGVLKDELWITPVVVVGES